MRHTATLLVLTALGCGCGGSTVGRAVGPGLLEAEAPAERWACEREEPGMDLDDASCLEGEGLAIAAAVRELAPAAYFGGERLVALHTEDAVLALGRLPEPEAHDVTLPVARAARRQTRSLDGAIEEDLDPLTLHLESLEVRRRGARAHVEAAWTLFWGSGEDAFREGLTAELERTDEGWRFARTRLHMLGSYYIGGPGDFDAAYYAERDARVEAARRGGDDAEAQRALRDALEDAVRYPEALEVARALAEREGATAADHFARARLALRFDEVDEARRARIAQRSAPMGDARHYARSVLRCAHEAPWEFPPMPSDDEWDESAPEPCRFELIGQAHANEGRPADVAALRITRGYEQAEDVSLLVAVEGEWRNGGFLGARAMDGEGLATGHFRVSDLELTQLLADPPLEVRMRYDVERPLPEGEGTLTERGFLVCITVAEDDAQCSRLPTQVHRRVQLPQPSASQSPPRFRESADGPAEITFDGEGHYTVRRSFGSDPRLSAGEHTIESLFGD